MTDTAIEGASEGGSAAFGRLRQRVKSAVDLRLAQFLEAKVASLPARSRDLEAVAQATSALCLRGGKRLRAVLLAAAYEAYGGAGGADAVVMAGVALELFQAYLLIHDDVMDGDDLRRGGPAVHATLRERFGSVKEGESAAILAGDLARAMAQEALLAVPRPAALVVDAARELARVEQEVVQGQILDVRAGAITPRAVDEMHALKTASYTTRGPLVMGAILAGAPEEERAKLARFATPLGVAFQLRDDCLGLFGDEAVTGKPKGSDLRHGKRTALVAELAGDATGEALLAKVLGNERAPADDVDALLGHIATRGAKARVEARLSARVEEAKASLAALDISNLSRGILAGAANAIAVRGS